MSILISDMEMPTGCSALTLKVWPDGQVEIIYAGGEWKTSEAVPIPEPHGRLIDADVFVEKCEEMADKEDGNQLDALVLLRWFLEQNAPTVIPASGEVGSSK